jgi:Glycosyltransferase family 87
MYRGSILECHAGETRDTKIRIVRQAASLRRIVSATIVILAFAAVATTAMVMVMSPGWSPTDAGTYRAAAERLNDGHFLYRLLPGDRPMALRPPFVTAPLLSPPPIAVLWRPLALLGDASLYLWWIGCVGAILLSLVLLARRRPLETGAATLLLTLPLGLALGWSNVDGYLLLALLGTWLAVRSGYDAAAGAMVATMIAIKLTPAPLVLWLLAIGRFRAFAAVAGFGIAWLAVSVAGAGLPAHFEYMDVVRNTLGPGTTDLSLAGLGRAVGLPAGIAGLLPMAWWVLCGVAIAVLRHRPGPAFAAAVLMQVLGSPVVQPYTFILLLALIAPRAWPWRTSEVRLAVGA